MRYSETEFETIYRQLFRPSTRLALSLLHDEDEARDIVHEVFLGLWESGRRPESPQSYILRSVKNACFNKISMLDNREKIRRRLSLEQPSERWSLQEIEDNRQEEIMTAVQRVLTEREKQIVGQIFSDGNSYKDAATNLGVSVATVNKHVVGALKKLRIYFQRKR